MTTLWQALTGEIARDPASPRVTFYERTPGPTSGERIELSGKVLLNWVSKAANMLTQEFDAEPGTRVAIHLPASHWRTVYWTLAAWACGCEVAFADSDAVAQPPVGDVLVTNVAAPGVRDQIFVTLAALARSADAAVPAGAFDEAQELSTYPDAFSPMLAPSGSDAALTFPEGPRRGVDVTFDSLLPGQVAERAYLAAPDPDAVFAHVAFGGGVVLIRGEVAPQQLAALLTQEGLGTA